MRRNLLFVATLLLSAGAFALDIGGDGCVDGACPIPVADDNGREAYAVVSPVGYHTVTMIRQAARLDTLAG